MKTRVNLLLDPEVVAAAKLQNINMSGVCNNLLRQYLTVENVNDDEVQILSQLEEAKRNLSNQQEKIAQLSVMLIQNREQREKLKARYQEDSKKRMEALQASGFTERIGEGWLP